MRRPFQHPALIAALCIGALCIAALCIAALFVVALASCDLRSPAGTRGDVAFSFTVSGRSAPNGSGAKLLLPTATRLRAVLTPIAPTEGEALENAVDLTGTGPATLTFRAVILGSYRITAEALDGASTVLFRQEADAMLGVSTGPVNLNLVPTLPDAVPPASSPSVAVPGVAGKASYIYSLDASSRLLAGSGLIINGAGIGTDVYVFVQDARGRLIASGHEVSWLDFDRTLLAGGGFLTVYNGGSSSQTPIFTAAPALLPVPAGTDPGSGVQVGAFRMGETEVTQAQFEALMGFDYSESSPTPWGPDIPVGNVTLYDAVAFCNALSVRAGLETVYSLQNVAFYGGGYSSSISSATVIADFSKNGYRLPTHAERVWAARGGSSATYPWGDDPAAAPGYEWYDANASGVFHPVAGKRPNGYGLYDMGGNLYEWVLSRLDSTPDYRRSGGTARNPISYLVPAWNGVVGGNEGGALGYYDNGFRVARGPLPGPLLSYSGNGSSRGAPPAATTLAAEVSVAANSGVLVGPTIRDGIGQRFTGWNTRADGSGMAYAPGALLALGTVPMTLYAQYTSDASVIGKVGPAGGLIFYDKGVLDTSPSGTGAAWRYLEAAPLAAETELWEAFDFNGSGYETVTGITMHNAASPSNQTGIGWGLEVTEYYATHSFVDNKGVTRGFNAGSSVMRFWNLSFGGKDDWFLPSKDELAEMYLRLHANGLGDFGTFVPTGTTQPSKYYWCSSWGTLRWDWKGFVLFADGSYGEMFNTNSGMARAVRRF